MSTQVANIDQPASGTQLQSIDDLPLARAVGELKEKFSAALPDYIPEPRFTRVALLAITKPEIAQAAQDSPQGRRSIYDALLRAATDGLLVDGREAALVVYNTKMKVPKEGGGVSEEWFKLVQYMPMVAGIRKKARNSGEIDDIICQCVYTNDIFENIKFGQPADLAPVAHEVDPKQEDRGAILGAYAYVRFKNGTYSQPEWMSKGQIDKIMRRTKSQDKQGNIFGPWKDDYEEMARKTVIKRGSKSWPASSDRDGKSLEELIRADDNLTDLAIEHERSPSLPAPQRKQMQAGKLLTTQPEPAPIDQPQQKQPDPVEAKTAVQQAADMPGFGRDDDTGV